MLKLNNAQVEALVSKIEEEIQEPVKRNNKYILESKEYVDFEKNNKDALKIKEICIKYNLDNTSYCAILIRAVRQSFFKNKIQKPIDIPYGEIKHQIILSTIDSNDINDLILKIKSKFV